MCIICCRKKAIKRYIKLLVNEFKSLKVGKKYICILPQLQYQSLDNKNHNSLVLVATYILEINKRFYLLHLLLRLINSKAGSHIKKSLQIDYKMCAEPNSVPDCACIK
jgi:hypothetical protein